MDNYAFKYDSDVSLSLKDYDVNSDGLRQQNTINETQSLEHTENDTTELQPKATFTIGGDEETEEHSRINSCDSRRVTIERNVFNQSRFDANFTRGRRPGPNLPQRASRKITKYIFTCSSNCCKVFLLNLFPFITIMKDYNIRTDLSGDIIAGLTVGIMHIPQGMAYGMLTTLPPIYGLYMSFVPVLVYFFFGSSKHISVGTFSVACLMIGTTVARGYESTKLDHIQNTKGTNTTGSDEQGNMSNEELNIRLSYAVSLTFVVGIFQICMGIARLGFVTVYLSDPLISGFTTGAACHVYTSQIKNVFGVTTKQYSGPLKLIYTYGDFFSNLKSQIKWAALIISMACWIVLYCVTRFVNHNDKCRQKMIVPVPVELIVVVLGTVLSYVLELNGQFYVDIVGEVPTGLPSPSLPFTRLGDVVFDALALSIVVFAISISMAKILAKKHEYEIDSNQELLAFGFCNIVSSFFSSPSTSASMSRSLTQERGGGKTQVAGLVSCALLLIVLLAIGPYFRTLPNCVLAAIILEKMRGIFLQVRDLKTLWHISYTDSFVWIVAFLATILLDVDSGLGVAVAFALLTSICRSQRPYACLMGRIPGTDFYQDLKVYKTAEEIPGIKVFRCEYSLLFINVGHFRTSLYKLTVNPNRLLIRQRQNGRSAGMGKSPTRYTGLANGGFELDIPKPNGDLTVIHPIENSMMAKDISKPVFPSGGDFHTIILDCSSWTFVDTDGVAALKSIIAEYKRVGINFLLANIKDGILETFEKTKFYTVVDRHDIFISLHDAVQHAQSKEETNNKIKHAPDSNMTSSYIEPMTIITCNGFLSNGCLREHNDSRETSYNQTVVKQ